MADAATITISSVILPDEIQKTITGGTLTYTPADFNDKWYFKITTVSGTTSTQLINGSLMSEELVASAHDTVTADTDLVKFLYIKNTSSDKTVYLTLDGTTVTSTSKDAIIIGPGETWVAKLQCEVEELLSIASSGSAVCNVAAIIDDGG